MSLLLTNAPHTTVTSLLWTNVSHTLQVAAFDVSGLQWFVSRRVLPRQRRVAIKYRSLIQCSSSPPRHRQASRLAAPSREDRAAEWAASLLLAAPRQSLLAATPLPCSRTPDSEGVCQGSNSWTGAGDRDFHREAATAGHDARLFVIQGQRLQRCGAVLGTAGTPLATRCAGLCARERGIIPSRVNLILPGRGAERAHRPQSCESFPSRERGRKGTSSPVMWIFSFQGEGQKGHIVPSHVNLFLPGRGADRAHRPQSCESFPSRERGRKGTSSPVMWIFSFQGEGRKLHHPQSCESFLPGRGSEGASSPVTGIFFFFHIVSNFNILKTLPL